MQCGVSEKTGKFSSDERISHVTLIKELFRKGKKYAVNGAKLFILPSDYRKNRIIFTFPRGYGTAVQRNRSKRVSREAYRHIRSHLQSGYDFLLLVYPEKDSYEERYTQLYILFEKANVMAHKT